MDFTGRKPAKVRLLDSRQGTLPLSLVHEFCANSGNRVLSTMLGCRLWPARVGKADIWVVAVCRSQQEKRFLCQLRGPQNRRSILHCHGFLFPISMEPVTVNLFTSDITRGTALHSLNKPRAYSFTLTPTANIFSICTIKPCCPKSRLLWPPVMQSPWCDSFLEPWPVVCGPKNPSDSCRLHSQTKAE